MSAVSDVCDANLVTQLPGCTDWEGEWIDPTCEGGHRHAGIDLGYSDGGNAHLGAPVRSPRHGLVVDIGPVYPPTGARYLGPYAPCILTDAEGVVWIAGHVQAVHVRVGDRVHAGQHVADLGSEGASTGGHLHMEVRKLGPPYQGPPWSRVLDPGPWLHYLPEEVFLMALTDDEQRTLYNNVSNIAGVVAKLDSHFLGDLPAYPDQETGLGQLAHLVQVTHEQLAGDAPAAVVGGVTREQLAAAAEAFAASLRGA